MKLQNKILRNIGKFPRNTPIRDINISFQIPYVYDNTDESKKMYSLFDSHW
jgi:hypothetical protein